MDLYIEVARTEESKCSGGRGLGPCMRGGIGQCMGGAIIGEGVGGAETSDEVGEIPLQHGNPITLNAKPFLLCLKRVKKFVVV